MATDMVFIYSHSLASNTGEISNKQDWKSFIPLHFKSNLPLKPLSSPTQQCSSFCEIICNKKGDNFKRNAVH